MDPWYEKFWKKCETDEFNTWWIDFYGGPEDYMIVSEYEIEEKEYYTRKAFALMGWLGRKDEMETQL